MKNFKLFVTVLLLITPIYACSTPEEKAAKYIANADDLLEQGKPGKAELEYRNALQINQNLPDAWYGLAKIHERRREWRKAYAALTRIRDAHPDHVNGRIMLAQLILASNQIDQALEDAKDVLQLAPQDTRAHALMAAVQFRLGNNQEAMASVDRAFAIDPNNNEALLVRARVLIEEKKYKEALAELDRAIETNPDNVSLYLMKIQSFELMQDRKGVEGVYKALIDRFPDQVAYRVMLARLYMLEDKVDAAERELEQIVAIRPDDIAEKQRLLTFKARYRSPEEAARLLNEYIVQYPEEYQYRFDLGELYVRNQQLDKAVEIYEQIIRDDQLQPNGLEARNRLAVLSLRAGDAEKARGYVDEVLTNDPGNENGLLLRAGFKISDRQYDDAIVDLRTVLRDNPDSVKALGLIGQAYDATGSQQLALESYAKAYQASPGTAVIANQLAKNLLRQGKYQQASEALQESMSSGNSSVEALKILTEVKLRLGEWDEAERLAKQLKDVEGQEALSEQVMGIVFQGREEVDQSITAFKQAHELAPDSSQPLVALVQTYVNNKNIPAARKFLDNVLAENDNNYIARTLLGRLHLLEQDVDQAILQFERVVEIVPQLEVGYRSLSFAHLRKNDVKKAEAVIQQGLKAIPTSQLLSINLASLYERQRRFGDAIAVYEALLEQNENLILAKNNLASLLTDYSDDQAGLDRARSISAELKDSRIPQFRDTYAWAAVKSGINLEEAIVILEGIVKENEQVDVYNYHLGEAYKKRGDKQQAIAFLTRATELANPNSDIYKKAKESLQQLN